jgi:hypothetical protein
MALRGEKTALEVELVDVLLRVNEGGSKQDFAAIDDV